ncbi:hypothetical protein ACHAXN_013153 [Cyclotella atomus]
MSNQQQPSTDSDIYSPTIVTLPPIPGDATSISHDDDSSPHSSSWQSDLTSTTCKSCHCPFDAFQRRHHCRLCGFVFCQSCSSTRSLIPPSSLVLRTIASTESHMYLPNNNSPSLEYRMQQARLPQRTCDDCRLQLSPLQEELRQTNSNAARYNYINDGDGIRSLCNSPLAFTLGHEVRKAAYALSNLLPSSRNKIPLTTVVSNNDLDVLSYPDPRYADPCRDNFKVDLTLRNVDKVHIPSRLLRKAKGIAIVTCAKGGLGFAGVEFGTGLVVARTSLEGEDRMTWSAPSALGLAGFSWGALIGAQVSDHIFLLMTEEAVWLFSTQDASIQLGVDVGAAVGPVGRSAEADLAASRTAMAPIYTYSLSKGLYAGVSMDGRVVVTRPRVNEKFYGRTVSAEELLNGSVPSPPAAQPLYDAIKRCLVYGDSVRGSNLPLDGNRANELDVSPTQESGYQSLNNRENNRSIAIPGGLFERLSHSTGLGMPVASPPVRTENPYNLAGRHDSTWQPNFSE